MDRYLLLRGSWQVGKRYQEKTRKGECHANLNNYQTLHIHTVCGGEIEKWRIMMR